MPIKILRLKKNIQPVFFWFCWSQLTLLSRLFQLIPLYGVYKNKNCMAVVITFHSYILLKKIDVMDQFKEATCKIMIFETGVQSTLVTLNTTDLPKWLKEVISQCMFVHKGSIMSGFVYIILYDHV